MNYRILADENVEPATRNYLQKLEHDVQWIGDIPSLGLGASDYDIAAYSRNTDRLVLTQDDDFFTELDLSDSYGVLFQKDQTLSNRIVGDIIDEMSEHIDQSDIDLEYISRE
jgi:predicted nuclease of predicted toxin-antitoxin system